MSFRTLRLSRRRLLRGAAVALAGGAALAPLAATARHKLAQKEVRYQATPKDGHSCAACRHFQPPHGCKIVAGTISPHGWCMMWAPKG